MRSAVGGFIAVLITLGSVGAATAQEKVAALAGNVKDDEGRNLEGATVEILGTKLTATTGEGGEFRFDNVRAGRYWILVRRIGFAPIRLTATLAAGDVRQVPLELERIPQRLSELAVLAHGGMSQRRYQDFLSRSHAAFGTFLTRDDLARTNAHDLVAVVQRHLPGKTRYTLERRTGDADFQGGRLYRRVGSGRLYARDELGFFYHVGSSALDVYHNPNCTPAISINGSTPWPGVALTDFGIEDVEAVEVYRRGSWVPTEFAYRDSSGCGLVVLWTK